MAAPTAQEQYFLELVNRARLNPLAEAQLAGIDLNQGLAAGTLTGAQKQPLAWNSALGDAATAHTNWMLAADVFSHTGSGGSTLGQRLTGVSYAYNRAGENIAWTGTTGALDFNASMSQLHTSLFKSSGHRTNILDGSFKELGIGAAAGQFATGGTAYNAAMVTQDFGKTGTASFVTGVAYYDSSGDHFYSIGEGVGSITTTLYSGGAAVAGGSTWSAGGYNLSTALTGTMTMLFSGGGLGVALGATFALGSENVKIDLVNYNTIESSVSAFLSDATANLTLLGINDTYGYGNALANTLSGNSGSNTLAGLAGNDVLNGNAGHDFLMGGAGGDALIGGAGVDWAYYGDSGAGVYVYLPYGVGYGGDAAGDTLSGIEYLWGSKYNDFLMGSADWNCLVGDSGNDTLVGGLSGDYLDGGSGIDWVSYAYAAAGVSASLVLNGGSGGEAAGDSFANIEGIWGSAFADQLSGDAGSNLLSGDGGGDVLTGGLGTDYFCYLANGFGADYVSDFADGVDLLYFSTAVAASFGALYISGNGTTDVTVSCAGGSISLHGAATITLTSADFLFA